MENKSAGINALLMCLREDLGRKNFDITDHWETETKAIGISKKGDEDILVYINVDDNEPIYYVALELPSKHNEYESAGEYNNLRYNQLLPIIQNHLGLGS